MALSVIDNFLADEEFNLVKETFLSNSCAWFFSSKISNHNEQDDNYEREGHLFSHIIYINHRPTSPFYEKLMPFFLNKINVKSLIRIKVNLYPYFGKYAEHEFHRDQEFSHSGAIFYVNSNNGHTILEDGTKIESVGNRIVFFDTNIRHKSTTCTDQRQRITINFNYF